MVPSLHASSSMRNLLGAFALLALLSSPVVAQDGFVLGYNQGWIEGKFGRDLTSAFDENEWRKVLARTRESGGSTLRVWLFEGQPCEGVIYDLHDPVGVDQQFLANIRRVGELAREERVKLYWTGFDGNFFGPPSGIEFDRRWNILNDKYGFGTRFQQNVLGPVLDAIMEKPDTVYAFDVMNEIQGSMHHNFWPDGWDGARRFMSGWTRFVHGRAKGLRTTVSSGWGDSIKDLLKGRFDGLGLDFLDVHMYSDSTRIEKGKELVARARSQGVPIVIGEIGQKKQAIDPTLQARIVKGVVEDAKKLGFAGVFVWRLIDEQAHDKRFSFWDGDVPRPAVAVMKSLAPAAAATSCGQTSKGLINVLGR